MVNAPGLPSRQQWQSLFDQEKLLALYQSIEQVWGSLVMLGPQLVGRANQLEHGITDDLDKLSRRIEALESHLGNTEEN
jgi:hypothetical protein